jgi:hypothetical protein
VIALYQWTPLIAGLAAPLLAWLIALGRDCPRRSTRLITLAMGLALVVEWVSLFAQVWAPGRISHVISLLELVSLTFLSAAALTGLLSYALWTLLLADAALAGNRRRLDVLTLVFAVTLVFQFAQAYRVTPLEPLRAAFLGFGVVGQFASVLLQGIVALAALIVALAFPASMSWTPDPTGASDPVSPAPR